MVFLQWFCDDEKSEGKGDKIMNDNGDDEYDYDYGDDDDADIYIMMKCMSVCTVLLIFLRKIIFGR